MFSIVKYMMYLGIAASAVVSCYAAYLHRTFCRSSRSSLSFSSAPFLWRCPPYLTIVQAVGALDLSKKGVLVTRLDSIEDASSIDVFCFDKTGTITQNQLSVTDCTPFGAFSAADAAGFAALASSEKEMDTIDSAILEYAKSSGSLPADGKQLSYLPFNPANKRTEATVQTGGKEYHVVKGSPQIIAEMCASMDEKTRSVMERTVAEYSEKGSRCIAVAVADGSDGSTFRPVGLLGFSDPPREDSAEMIQNIRELGIRPMMLTGDNRAIAREIAGQVGIGTRIGAADSLKGLDSAETDGIARKQRRFRRSLPGG